MRLSTSLLYQQTMQNILHSQSTWQQVGQQLSTGKRVINPSDDPVSSSLAVTVSQSQAENSQYTLARSFARHSMALEETVLRQVTDSIQAMQVLVVNAGNGALSDDDRHSLAIRLQGLKAQLLNQANSTDGIGHFIFAGFVSDKPPFAANSSGSIDYNGGDTAVLQQVDANRIMTVGHTGNRVFMALTSHPVAEPNGAPSEPNLFNTIDLALESLTTSLQTAPNTVKQHATEALDKANRGLRNALNNVLSVRAELGTQLEELDNLDSNGNDRHIANQSRLSELQDAELIEVIAAYTLQKTALQASYKMFTDMQNLSLFQLK